VPVYISFVLMNKSTNILADNMKHFEYLCYSTISNWLNEHFHYTVLLLFLLTLYIQRNCTARHGLIIITSNLTKDQKILVFVVITPMTFNRWLFETCYSPIMIEIFLYFIWSFYDSYNRSTQHNTSDFKPSKFSFYHF
jgi:hypothetical protein